MVKLELYNTDLGAQFIRVKPEHVSSLKDASNERVVKSQITLSNGLEFDVCGNVKQIEKKLGKFSYIMRNVAALVGGVAGAMIGKACGLPWTGGMGISLILIIAVWMRWHD
jgi:hypothetical protein